MNTWSCARCGTAAFADQNFCRACGMPREGRRSVPITSQVPIIRTGVKADTSAAEEPDAIDDPRTSASQLGTRRSQGVRKRPISLAMLAAIAAIFLVLGGVGAVIFGHVSDDSTNDPVQTPPATTSVPTHTSHRPSTTSAAPTTTKASAPTTQPASTTIAPPTTTIEPPSSAPPTSSATTAPTVNALATSVPG